MSITYCCNPQCPAPHNRAGLTFCEHCGARLRLGDRYGAYNAMGGGGSSRTYLGLDTRQLFDPRCIIKSFVQDDNTEKAMESFRREVAILDEVGRHPQLPTLYAYYERGNQQYLVQEFVEGDTLLHTLADQGSFDEAQIRDLLSEVLPVLQWLHDHKIIHRDVKPANLVRRSPDTPLVLVDFGAAKYVSDSAVGRTGTVIGSAEYIAPEQLIGHALFASDLYSLGVTCLHLLTGLRPFDLYDSASGQWFWQSVAGPVSETLVRVLNRLLERNPSDRYPSATAVLQELHLSPVNIHLSSPPAPAPAPQTWGCIRTIETPTVINAIATVSQHNWIVSGGNDGILYQWSLDTGECVQTLQGHHGAIAALALTTDGTTLFSAGWDHQIHQWNLAAGELVQSFQGHTDVVTSLVLDEPRQRLISGSRDRTIRLWDMAQAKPISTWNGHRAAIEALAIAPEPALLASSDEAGQVILWHLKTQELLRRLSKHTATVAALALTGDGVTLVSSGWDMSTKLRYSDTGGVRLRLTGHQLPVSGLVVSPDQRMVWSSSQDGTIRGWDIPSGRAIATVQHHTTAIEAIAMTPDGCHIISGGQDKTLRIWSQTAD